MLGKVNLNLGKLKEAATEFEAYLKLAAERQERGGSQDDVRSAEADAQIAQVPVRQVRTFWFRFGSSSRPGLVRGPAFFCCGPAFHHRPRPGRGPPADPTGGPSAGRARIPTASASSPSPKRSAWSTSGPPRRPASEDFGENRVQEALQKIDGSADLTIRWHLIGTLQSNKVRKAASRFSAIHSVDSLRLLRAIDAAATEAGTTPELLVQVDLAGEATKHGAPPARSDEIVRAADALPRGPRRRADDDSAVLRRPGGRAAVFRPAPGPSRYTAERGTRAGTAAGTVDGNEPRFRNRRAGGSHDGAARHGHFWGTPCLILTVGSSAAHPLQETAV